MTLSGAPRRYSPYPEIPLADGFGSQVSLQDTEHEYNNVPDGVPYLSP